MQVELKQFRKLKGLSQGQLAAKVGIQESYVSRIERGEREPGVELAIRIAQVVDAGVTQIWKPGPVAVQGGADLNRREIA